MSTTTSEVRALDLVVKRVGVRFPESRPEEIQTLVERAHQQYDGRPVREFVPVLVEREVTETLYIARQRQPATQQLTST